MHILKRFGETGSSKVYGFPANQLSYLDNFGDLVTKTSRLAFSNGGLDELGSGRGLSEIGNVQAEFWLHFDSDDDADEQIDGIRSMNDWGVQRLFMQPHNQDSDERWCLARINDISGGQNVRDMPRDRQRMKVTFQVANPFWYTNGNQALWDGTYDWDGTIDWDGSGLTTVTGSGTLSVTNNGNAYTQGRFVAEVTGAQPFNQLIVRRLVNSAVVDQMVLDVQFVQNDVIEIDPRKQWVLVNGVDQFASFSFKHPDWLRLLPGVNSIEVVTDQSTAALSTVIRYFERYV
jgi:hypothetical protein